MMTIHRGRRALLVLIGVAAVLLLSGRGPRVHADVVYTDVTGTSLRVTIRLPDADTGNLLEVPAPTDQLPPAAKALLTTPLSALFDTYWSGKPDSSGQTLRDQSCVQAIIQTGDAVASATNGSAHDITCNLAATGALRASLVQGLFFMRTADFPEGNFVDGTRLVLSYYLSGNSIAFSVTPPAGFDLGFLGATGLPWPSGADPRFTVTFDTEIILAIVLPDADLTSAGACAFTLQQSASVETHNAYLDSANITGDLVKDVNAILRGVGFTGIFPPAEDALNRTTFAEPTPLDGQLGPLGAGCTVLEQLGFRQFDASVDADQGVTLRFTHPRYGAPTVSYAGRSTGIPPTDQPSFFRPLLNPTQPTVGAGNTLTLQGKYFPPNASTALHIGIAASGFGQCTGGRVEVEWGVVGGATQRTPLAADSMGNCPDAYDAASLTPATNYQFRARTCDTLTCSDWSPFVQAATGTAGDDSVALTLDDGSKLGTATVTSQGTFSGTVTIPAGTPAGVHTIHAALGAAQADTTVQVQAAGAVSAATITIVSSQGTPLTSTVTDDSFTLFGTGFTPGTVLIYLDSQDGFQVGSAPVQADGTFRVQLTVPYAQAGPHTLLAVEDSISATDAVTFVTPSVVR